MDAPTELPRDALTEALEALGEVLAYRGSPYELVLVGGANLLLAGVISRPTKDADLVGQRLVDGRIVKLATMPQDLAVAVRDVGATYDLGPEWVNVGPSELMDRRLPTGFDQRLTARRFGALTLWLAGSFDMICFKLYAVADQMPTPGRHLDDLLSLSPSKQELADAADWCKDQDPSTGFALLLNAALERVRTESPDD